MCPTSEVSAHPHRLLVVDDEPSILKFLKTILSRAHYEVMTADSAEAALKILSHDSFDCIITDAVMPHLSGYDFVKQIRTESEYKDLPILMLTRKRHRKDVKQAVDAGVTDYVVKPIDEHLLLEKVEICVKKGTCKRKAQEVPIHGEWSECKLSVSGQITCVTDAHFTMRLAHPVEGSIKGHSHRHFDVTGKLFSEIGISNSNFRLISCQALSETESQFPYEAVFSFVGIADSDLKKLRNWLAQYPIKK